MKNIGQLEKRLNSRIARENEELEKRIQSAYDDLSGTLSKHMQGVINTTQNDMDSLLTEWRHVLSAIKHDFSEILTETREQNQAIQNRQIWAWAKPALIGLILCASIFFGSWGMMRYLTYMIQTQLQQQATITKEIARERKTLHLLKDRTWGVTLHQDSNGRFVVLPRGAKIDTTWTWNKRPAIKFWRK